MTLVCLDGPGEIIRVLISAKRSRRKKLVRTQFEKDSTDVAGFEDGEMGPWTK